MSDQNRTPASPAHSSGELKPPAAGTPPDSPAQGSGEPTPPAVAASLSELLLPLLAPDGPLQKRLEEAQKISNKRAPDELRRKLLTDLETIHDALRSPENFFRFSNPKGPDEVCRCVLKYKMNVRPINLVLRYVLALQVHYAGDLDSLPEEALEEYQKSLPAYDELFGDLIPEDVRETALSNISREAYDQGSNPTALHDWDQYRDRVLSRREEPFLGPITGIVSLDEALRGLRAITIFGGLPGVGKTTLALQIAAGVLRHNENVAVLFYSLDMPKTVLYDRLLCAESGIDYRTLLAQERAEADMPLLVEAGGRLQREVLPRLRIRERLQLPESAGNLAHVIKQDIEDLIRATDVPTVLTVIDYFQLMPVPASVKAPLEQDFYRVQMIQEVQNWGRRAVCPAGDPFLVISELRKGDPSTGKYGITDLLGSGRLGYSAEAVMILDKEDDDGGGEEIPLQLRIVKGRDGVMRKNINLIFEHTKSRFREVPVGKKRATTKSKAAKATTERLDPLGGKEGPP